MATRIASMRCLSTIFQSVLASRCNVISIKRYVRRHRPVSGLTSNNEPIENVKQNSSQFSEHLFNDNTHRISEKARGGLTSVSQKHDNNPVSVQFSHKKVMNVTTLPRFGEVDGLLYEKSRPGDKSVT